jgi:biopolymer transport protein TolR
MMRRHRKPINQINVVPYIDVMLVLLIIFMVTAPLVAPGEIELPSVGSKLTVPAQPIELTLVKDRSGAKRVMVVDKQLNAPAYYVGLDDLGRLAEQLVAKQKDREQPVVIAADKGAVYDDVLAILDSLQRNGVKKVGLLARPPAK